MERRSDLRGRTVQVQMSGCPDVVPQQGTSKDERGLIITERVTDDWFSHQQHVREESDKSGEVSHG